MSTNIGRGGVMLAALVAVGCAGRDNPAALAELEGEVEFEIQAARVETFDEIEIRTRVTQDGNVLPLQEAWLEIEAPGGAVQLLEMERDGDSYAARVAFFEAGEHYVTFEGAPIGHSPGLTTEMGSRTIEVNNPHRIVGPYWVEMELSPAPMTEGDVGSVHFKVFDFDGVGPAQEVMGLEIQAEQRHHDGSTEQLGVEEGEPGEYEAAVAFPEAGLYTVRVEIAGDEMLHEGEFPVPVLSGLASDTEEDENSDGGDDGHG